MTVSSVVINVVDYERQKAFWTAVLGTEVANEHAPYFCWLRPQHPGGISVALQTVEDPTEGPRRLHIDADVGDIDVAKAKILDLGGSVVADREINGFHWTTMADPEGNEFCIAVH